MDTRTAQSLDHWLTTEPDDDDDNNERLDTVQQEHAWGTMVWHTCGHHGYVQVTAATMSERLRYERAQPCRLCRDDQP